MDFKVSSRVSITLLFVLTAFFYLGKISYVLSPIDVLTPHPLLGVEATADQNAYERVSDQFKESGEFSGIDPYVSGGVPFGWGPRPHRRMPILIGLIGEWFNVPSQAIKAYYFLGLLALPVLFFYCCFLLTGRLKTSLIAFIMASSGIAYFIPYSFYFLKVGQMNNLFAPFFALAGSTSLLMAKNKKQVIFPCLLSTISYLMNPAMAWFILAALMGRIYLSKNVEVEKKSFWVFLGFIPALALFTYDFISLGLLGNMAKTSFSIGSWISDWAKLLIPFSSDLNSSTQPILRGFVIIFGLAGFFSNKTKLTPNLITLYLILFLSALFALIFSPVMPLTKNMNFHPHLILIFLVFTLPSADFIEETFFAERNFKFLLSAWVLWFLATRQVAEPGNLPHLNAQYGPSLSFIGKASNSNSVFLLEDIPSLRPYLARAAREAKVKTTGIPMENPLYEKEWDERFGFNPRRGSLDIFKTPLSSFSAETLMEALKEKGVGKVYVRSHLAQKTFSYLADRHPNLQLIVLDSSSPYPLLVTITDLY